MSDRVRPHVRPLRLDAVQAASTTAGEIVGHVAGALVGEVDALASWARRTPTREHVSDGAWFVALLPVTVPAWLVMTGATLALAPSMAAFRDLMAAAADAPSPRTEALRRRESA